MLRPFLLSLLSLTSLVFAQTPPPAHDHGAMEIPGLKKELFAGITPEDLLKPGTEPKSVKVKLVATFNAVNYGMNFNGYSHGKAVLTIPTGWKVDVTFINPSPIPHSAIVTEQAETKKLQVPEPYFEGGATPKHLTGMTMGQADFSFTPDEAGEFALACGFPAHAVAGHWISLIVSDDATVPTLKLGEQGAVEVK
ncbi:sulfocyanin-like copper-binding protein [Prosthecobacter sp. SYSU 5D2]|uniref:sulfocyanin-like copper-binding protein n=1 Tax=Prosthecobacter sp. SYSU 5D2 TaxID=3134134 RepID=UPI0031FEACA4